MSKLEAVLDTLLPGGEGFPAASSLGLAAWLEGQPAFLEPARPALDALPDDFADRDFAAREAALHDLEAADPIAFGLLIRAAYAGYYVHPTVLARISEATGYSTRPPQSDGYSLPPFDPAIVAIPASRPPSWRKA